MKVVLPASKIRQIISEEIERFFEQEETKQVSKSAEKEQKVEYDAESIADILRKSLEESG